MKKLQRFQGVMDIYCVQCGALYLIDETCLAATYHAATDGQRGKGGGLGGIGTGGGSFGVLSGGGAPA